MTKFDIQMILSVDISVRIISKFLFHSSYDGEFRMPLVLAQASPIFHSSCEGKLGIALE